MERGVEWFAVAWFGVVGLSHLVQPVAWVEFFGRLREWGRPGAFVEGFLCLGFGAFVVAFHDVWTWPAGVLTVVGWLQLLKGAMRFALPELALKLYALSTVERAWHFRAAGVFSFVMAGLFAWAAIESGRAA